MYTLLAKLKEDYSYNCLIDIRNNQKVVYVTSNSKNAYELLKNKFEYEKVKCLEIKVGDVTNFLEVIKKSGCAVVDIDK